MNKRFLWIVVVLLGALLLSSCGSRAQVGELRSESQSVELGNAKSVDVNVDFGAGDLVVTGGAAKLLEADFNYNVAELKPVVEFSDGTLSVEQPGVHGLPIPQGITDFRNEWNLRLADQVPMNLKVNMGAGNSDFQLAGLSLTGLDLTLGAGISTIDLNNDWARDLDVSIDTGAADIAVRLPKNIGVRVEVQEGPHTIDAPNLTKDGRYYTNTAYGESPVTLHVSIRAGIGRIRLEVEEKTQAEAALKKLLDQQVEKQNILGMVMAERLADGTVIWSTAGYLDPAGKARWDAHTPSLIASVTKTFTAVVLMQLVEVGKLSLDDTIDTWFPEQPNGDKITVRMLLSHTSGLANYSTLFGMDAAKWTREWTPEELIAVANEVGPVGEPGSSAAHYSNTNYIMLGLIIEKVTGESWFHEVESRIITPLDLKETRLGKEGMWNGDVVTGYIKAPDGYISIVDFPWYPHSSTAWAAGGLVSSTADVMTFASALFDGKLVSKESLAVMAQPLGTEGDRQWGLGGGVVELAGRTAFGMGGDTTGYHAFFIGVPGSKLVVTALVNTDEGDVIAPGMAALQDISQ